MILFVCLNTWQLEHGQFEILMCNTDYVTSVATRVLDSLLPEPLGELLVMLWPYNEIGEISDLCML